MKRISDYYHHPYDVVTGALVGIVFASSTLLVMADVFNKRFLKLLLSWRNDFLTHLALCTLQVCILEVLGSWVYRSE